MTNLLDPITDGNRQVEATFAEALFPAAVFSDTTDPAAVRSFLRRFRRINHLRRGRNLRPILVGHRRVRRAPRRRRSTRRTARAAPSGSDPPPTAEVGDHADGSGA